VPVPGVDDGSVLVDDESIFVDLGVEGLCCFDVLDVLLGLFQAGAEVDLLELALVDEGLVKGGVEVGG